MDRRGLRAIVGHRSGLDHDGSLQEELQDGSAHLIGGLDSRDLGGVRGHDGGRPGDQQDAGTAPERGLGKRVTHATAGAVRDVAHWIDFLASRAGRNQNSFAGQVLRSAQSLHDCGHNAFVGGEASRANHAACEVAAVGFDDLHAALAQNFKIGLGGRMIPHVDVHRRSDDDGCGGREVERGQEITGNPLRKLRQYVGGRRRDHECIDRLCNRNMFDSGIDVGLGVSSLEHAGDNFFPGKCGEGERTHEFLRGLGHDDLYADFAILQQADDFRRFVGCDPAAYAKSYLHGVRSLDDSRGAFECCGRVQPKQTGRSASTSNSSKSPMRQYEELD